MRRFNDLQATTDPQLLDEETDLPTWLRGREGYSIWQRSNLWMLHTAFALGDRVTLMALWNRGSRRNVGHGGARTGARRPSGDSGGAESAGVRLGVEAPTPELFCSEAMDSALVGLPRWPEGGARG